MSVPLMEKITQERGLILWIPDKLDKTATAKISKALNSEIGFLEKTVIIHDKDKIINTLKRALMHFPAYPNRILRFDEDISFSWENPSRPIRTFMYRYNP